VKQARRGRKTALPERADTFDLGRLLAEHAGEGLELYGRHANPPFRRMLATIGFDRAWSRAEGAYLYDADGTRFLDWLGGFGMFNVGRHNPVVAQALADALAARTPSLPQLGLSDLPGLLAAELVRISPPGLDRVLFVNSGAEAIEAAVKLGRAATGRQRVIALANGFHGLTLGALSLNGAAEERRRFEPLLPGVSFVRPGDLDELARELARDDVAVLVAEPVQGRGVVIPDQGYLPEVQRLCRKHGTLFCLDEVQTGLGRTGRMFAAEHWGLEPDLLTVAKSLSGGYVPVGALLLRAHVHAAVFDSLEHATSHGSTFAPGDLAMAAGLATIAELERQRLVDASARLGEVLLARTEPLVDRFAVVRDVRGLGLMWAIEFAEPTGGSRSWRLVEARQPALFSQFVVGPLFRKHHVLSQVAGHSLNVVKGLPPLVVDEDDLEWFVTGLEDSIARATRIARSFVSFAARASRGLRV
jgi:ornithine--oxo-acid transaminase